MSYKGLKGNLSLERFEELLELFFDALRSRRLLVVIDSSSRGSRAVFSLVCYDVMNGRYVDFSPLLLEIGVRVKRGYDELFVIDCAGRYSLFILDGICNRLRHCGVELPEFCQSSIQNQNVI